MVENLYCQTFGEQGQPLLILHGLFGSGTNWQAMAKRLARQHRVLLPDLRNHGHSPHNKDMGYPAMVEDILALLAREHITQTQILGHSMGGKLAMWFALTHPRQVQRLVIADIAPVAYSHDFREMIQAMQALKVAGVTRRSEADAQLAAKIPKQSVRQFLLQNLVREKDGYRWRIPLSIFAADTQVMGFPATPKGLRYPGATLFLHGTRSNYVKPTDHSHIAALFPRSQIASLAAGHWLHAECPSEFLQKVTAFLEP